MPSALQHTDVVDHYIQSERAEGRFLGPLVPANVPNLHTSRMGVIPKGRVPGKWRLITDLSFPEGASVNDGIDSEPCSLQYTSVEKIAKVAYQFGPQALLAKVDIKAAYRLVPVHPDDRPLLGVVWQGSHYVDAMLPFGLRSAPKIFTALADALEWCIRQHSVPFIDHYLDDFIIVGPPHSDVCARALAALEEECAQLGVPLAPEKKEGPSTCITFLGIQIDTESGQLSLPQEKLTRLKQDIERWLPRRKCRKQELDSLIGTLQYAAKVIHPGRSFVRRLIELQKQARRAHHYIRLHAQVRADLLWWKAFAEHWNGITFFPAPTEVEAEFASDASGSWGCGAWSDTMWWQYKWPPKLQREITFKELFAVIIATAVWGPGWQGKRVRAHCDNLAVVEILKSRSSRDPHLMHLLRCLFFIEATNHFTITPAHIAGAQNSLADDLSRDWLSSFLQKAPWSQSEATWIPASLPGILLDTSAMWTSEDWMQRFRTSATRA